MFNINNPMMTNKRINGKRINNHEIPVCPSLHIKFKIQVQKRTYIIFIVKTNIVLGTLHENDPT